MFSLAASLALPWLMLAPASFDSDAYSLTQLSNTEQQVWHTLQPSILIVSQNGQSRGSAVCIDASGLYLAHQNSIHLGEVDGVTLRGQPYPMRVLANDKATGLILLQVTGSDLPKCPVVHVANEDHARQSTLLAVLNSGPVRADIGHPNIVATYEKTNQSVMLNEIRFVAPTQLLTGALLFDDRGELVGVLGATLPKQGGQSITNANTLSTAKSEVADSRNNNASGQSAGQNGQGGAQNGFGGAGQNGGGNGAVQNRAGGGGAPAGQAAFARSVGPADLNVAYAVSPLLLNRVIGGFLSPNHEVQHPALGAFCEDEMVNGVAQAATIAKINPGSGAAKAGLQVGDVILNIDGTEIHNVVDYARVMLTKEVGHKVTLAIRRKDKSRQEQTIPIDAIVGRVTSPDQLQKELNQILR